MPLVPGKLPPGTCYGTPQQLLEAFSQHLSVAGTDQGILYTTTSNSAPVVVDPTEPSPRLWVDRALNSSPILYGYGGVETQNWVQIGAQTKTKRFLHTDFNSIGGSSLAFCFPLFSLPPRSMIHWIAIRTTIAFLPNTSGLSIYVRMDPDTTLANPYKTGGTTRTGTTLVPTAGTGHSLLTAATTEQGPTIVYSPEVTSAYFSTSQPFSKYTNGSNLYVEVTPASAGFSQGAVQIWVNYSQLQG
jgi:hypothetical protein